MTDIDIFESGDSVGGLAMSFSLWGQTVDLGPHRFFSLDDRINDFWLDMVGEDHLLINRLTRIYYGKKFYLYPVQSMDALKKMGFAEAAACMASYLAVQFRGKGEERTFEDWVSRRFGKKLYTMFFKSYSERLWGIPCTELDADFARQRIKGLNMREVVRDALFGGGGKKHKTLVEQFAYPLHGAGEPYEKLTKKLEAKGVRLHLDTPVTGIRTTDAEGKKRADGVILADGGVCSCNAVVSCAPLTDMILNCDAFSEEQRSDARKLRYRNTTLVYLRVVQDKIFEDNWIYVHDPSVQMGRITNFRNWSPEMLNGEKDAILCLEYWSFDEDSLWKMRDEELIEQAKMDIVKTGLVEAENISDGYVLRLHRSYPVYTTGYQEILKPLQEAVDAVQNLMCIGRNGSFKYNNQDHSILMGLLAAENILSSDHHHDLWAVNTDYDYQEREKNSKKAIS